MSSSAPVDANSHGTTPAAPSPGPVPVPPARAFAALLEATGVAAVLLDGRGRVAYANAAAERLVGRSGGALLGAPLAAAYDARSARLVHEAVERVRAGEAEVEIPRARRVDGQAHALRVVATPGGETGVLLHDAAPGGPEEGEEDGAWPDRQASDARFRALAEEAPVGVLLCDPAGLVVYANPRAGEIAGRLPGELLGTGLASAIDRGDMARVVAAWRAFVVGDAPVLRVEYRVLRRSGELRTVHAQLRRLPAPDGRALGFVAVLDDVTEALRADEAMRRAERMEELGQLAGGLAHEFNNLLTIIRGNLAFARGGLPPGSTAHDDLGEVDRAAERAGLLVRQLLALGRRQVLRLERVDVRAVVRDVTPRLRALCRPEVLLDVVWSAEPGVVRADAVQLAQVVANLVANACDAMPHGGTVSVDTGTATLGDDAASRAWGALPAGAYARLTVRDTGTGMDDAARARAFEPFFSTKPHGTGMGLGLPVAYGIVTQSGGGMRVESAPGRGTVVTVLLPLLAHEITEWPMEPVPGGSEVVLVAEASPALRGALARLLAAAGYAVEGVSTAADAVARARGGAYALLLCAAALPDGGGAAVAARVRRAHASLPVLLVARDDGEAASAAHAAASADGGPPTTWVLRAPLLGREVLATVRAALDGRPA